MAIEAVDFFYLAMPDVRDVSDGSQDALLVRIAADGLVGWGECEASPLVSIASFVCPLSHSRCQPVQASVLGQKLEAPADIAQISRLVQQNSSDLLQAAHTLSGIDMALWDLLGKQRDQPVYRLLGYERAYPKKPYASMLFGSTPQATLDKARALSGQGFSAVKFAGDPFGRGSVEDDNEQIIAAREGIGPDGLLLIDAGTVWGDDWIAASARMPMLKQCRVTWLEEPFHTAAYSAYRELARACPEVGLAAGEASHSEYMAQHMMDYAGLRYIQIDTGRVGGITAARRVAQYAEAAGVTFVNHTFTSHLALSASLQPYAGLQTHELCEYPVESQRLAFEMTTDHLVRDAYGEVRVPERPGLGVEPDTEALKPYLIEVVIEVKGRVLYRTPDF
jgi:L-alanine-DL-glutamate epimerase-like enolase superfamily enzyme